MRSATDGFTVKHFHEHLQKRHHVVEGDHQIVLPIIARQPGEARGVPWFREGRLWCSFIPTTARLHGDPAGVAGSGAGAAGAAPRGASQEAAAAADIVTNRSDPEGGSGLDLIRWHRGRPEPSSMPMTC
jgi:hypothetical protein